MLLEQIKSKSISLSSEKELSETISKLKEEKEQLKEKFDKKK